MKRQYPPAQPPYDQRARDRDAALEKVVLLETCNENLAHALAEAIREKEIMFENLTATQTRCTELLDTSRALRRVLASVERG